eukprot:403338238
MESNFAEQLTKAVDDAYKNSLRQGRVDIEGVCLLILGNYDGVAQEGGNIGQYINAVTSTLNQVMVKYPNFRPASSKEITLDIKGVQKLPNLPDLFEGNSPNSFREFRQRFDEIIDHCKDNIDDFRQALQEITDSTNGQHFVCGLKVSENFGDNEIIDDKPLLRIISKIFESKYTDNDFKKINGIGQPDQPKGSMQLYHRFQRYHFEDGWIETQLKRGLIAHVGDLMRCKAMFPTCHDIVKALKMLGRRYTILRLKNRLATDTRDILVNFLYDPKTPCEIQLCLIDPNDDSNANIRSAFNHKIYEISRDKLGPIVTSLVMDFDSLSHGFDD